MSVFAVHPMHETRASRLVQDVLRSLLERNAVEAVLAPCLTRDGRSVQLSLLRHPDQIAQARPLLPVMPVSAARMAGMLCERVQQGGEQAAPARRVAAVMRPCEARATVELAKLRQVDPGQLLLVVLDCIGTVEEPALRESGLDPEAVQEAMLDATRAGRLDSPLEIPFRHACSICVHPTAAMADVSIHLIGTGQGEGLLLELKDAGLLDLLGLVPAEDAPGRDAAVGAFASARAGRRQADLDAVLAAMAPRPDGMPGIAEAFELCLRCGNCSTACPLCYCKECLFRTDALRQEPARLIGLADRRGAARLPGDGMTFQLTRLSHVSTSCVGCGVCSSACPSHLPVDSLFQAVAQATQALFDYEAGRSLEDPLPTTTFKRDEFVELGEA